MDDMIGFLRARLNEDEQAAHGAMWCKDAGVWRAEPSPYETRGARQRWYIEDSLDDGVVSYVNPVASDDEGAARHIARHDPARVLREVGAKRRILDEMVPVLDALGEIAYSEGQGAPWPGRPGEYMTDREPSEHLLKLLALPYADHPDYQKKWRP
jgi:hypothetical protein